MSNLTRDILEGGVPSWARTINVTIDEFFQIRSSWNFVERARFKNNRATFHGLLVYVVDAVDVDGRYSEAEPPIQVRIVPNGTFRYQIKDATSGWPYGPSYGTYGWAVAKARREGWEVVEWEDDPARWW